MSAQWWGYEPGKCDNSDICKGRGSCDGCPIATEGGHMPLEYAYLSLECKKILSLLDHISTKLEAHNERTI